MPTDNWLEYAKIDPELEKILDGGPAPKLPANVPIIRKVISDRQAAVAATKPGPPEGVVEKEITITAQDGYEIPVRIHSPESSPAGGSPVVIIIHGGGFCTAGPDAEEGNCRDLVKEFGAVCVNVDYRLAPEHPFPIAIQDCWDVVKWTAANAAQTLKADPSQGFLVGGTSAGGNLAAVMGLAARDAKLSPPITGLALSVPNIVHHEAVPEKYKPLYQSYEQNKDAAILGQATMNFFWENYSPDTSSWLSSPLNHPDGLKGLPPTYIQVCGMDPLRDEALIFEKVLREESGVPTKLDIYPGVPHTFWVFWVNMAQAKKFKKDAVKGIGWLLGKE
ncbi:hypothetical protein K432DRAFT_410225 [Lepidopterella palustris CBS 459.81]|uniref:Alpha/beta hydrolase fold-3 domain-containing protein n=1 Tax=Lepidopterella palustris CBS 459.81 TaxID=1314670 RepID=A0A8E2DYS6_9PEZI|nr:hypothetical protein K432DRAFT_410225 [Lepidopterella palustris CBS 459.81]